MRCDTIASGACCSSGVYIVPAACVCTKKTDVQHVPTTAAQHCLAGELCATWPPAITPAAPHESHIVVGYRPLGPSVESPMQQQARNRAMHPPQHACQVAGAANTSYHSISNMPHHNTCQRYADHAHAHVTRCCYPRVPASAHSLAPGGPPGSRAQPGTAPVAPHPQQRAASAVSGRRCPQGVS